MVLKEKHIATLMQSIKCFYFKWEMVFIYGKSLKGNLNENLIKNF